MSHASLFFHMFYTILLIGRPNQITTLWARWLWGARLDGWYHISVSCMCVWNCGLCLRHCDNLCYTLYDNMCYILCVILQCIDATLTYVFSGRFPTISPMVVSLDWTVNLTVCFDTIKWTKRTESIFEPPY